ncbi:hypothetical protein QUF75_02900 [Desulfococcaceae bacterium HSG7]|nr:hypothetical protein [Desulfococcaceae bacterium HSG7]
MKDLNTNHPVWDVYNLYRISKENVEYFSSKLHSYTKHNTLIEIILAITTASSAVGALWFQNSPFGQQIWKILVTFSAFIAAIKPIINYTDKIRKYEEILTGYRALENDLEKITILIKQSKKYEKIHRSKLFEAIDRHGKLKQKSPEIKIDEKLLKKCQLKVKSLLPSDIFFVPED